MQVFGTLKLLMAFLGLSWPLLARSGPKIDPRNCPMVQKLPKVGQKIDLETSNKTVNLEQFSGPIFGPLMVPNSEQTPTVSNVPVLTGPVFRVEPRWPKTTLRWPKIVPKWAKTLPRWPKMAPR